MKVFIWIDWFLFVVFTVNIFYLLFYSIASHFSSKKKVFEITTYKKIGILIPSYKEDFVIKESVEACLCQNYPKEKYDIIVIADQMKEETNEALRAMGAKVVKVLFENSTKAKALNYAMSVLGDYEVALVLDSDNIIKPDFLQKINQEMVVNESKVVQAHRMAKNTNTNIAFLDAVSEEINNTIFRLGHVNIGVSSALIGSGMAFDYSLFKKTMANIDAVGGVDKELEFLLMKDGYFFAYLPDALVEDEKVQSMNKFSNQRKRWLSAQFCYLICFSKFFWPQLLKGNIDFVDKYLQQLCIPRVLLIGLTILITIIVSLFSMAIALKWWVILFCLVIAISLAIPKSLWHRKMCKALVSLPFSFLTMFSLLFKLKGANKKFIHTEHGIVDMKDDKNKI